MLAVSRDALYRRWRQLPFAFKGLDGKLKFSSRGVQRYLADRQLRGNTS